MKSDPDAAITANRRPTARVASLLWRTLGPALGWDVARFAESTGGGRSMIFRMPGVSVTM